MDTLTSLRVFCMVAELQSFTATARRLDQSPAMVSKHVSRLEDRLGTRLLNRTSRHVSLTEAGALYLAQVRQMLDGLDEVEAALSNVAVSPRGTLKLSAPVWIANTVIARMFVDYHRRYPDVCLDIDLSGRITNLVDEGFDLALRAMAPDRLDPGLIVRPLRKVEFCLMGAPSYLERAGRPSRTADLNGHSLLLYSRMTANGHLPLEGPDGRETVKFRPVMQSGNETMLHLAALEGMGLVFLPLLLARQDIAEGHLEMVLSGALRFSTNLHLVYPSRKYLSAKVRTFIDFLVLQEELQVPEDFQGAA